MTITTKATTGRTFEVSRVAAARAPLPERPYRKVVEEFLGTAVESCPGGGGSLVAGIRSHPVIGALHEAFNTHRPVTLSPDIIWVTICQGLAHHVNLNAESLRRQLVRYDVP